MGSVLFVFTPFMALLFTLVVFYVIGNKNFYPCSSLLRYGVAYLKNAKLSFMLTTTLRELD